MSTSARPKTVSRERYIELITALGFDPHTVTRLSLTPLDVVVEYVRKVSTDAPIPEPEVETILITDAPIPEPELETIGGTSA